MTTAPEPITGFGITVAAIFAVALSAGCGTQPVQQADATAASANGTTAASRVAHPTETTVTTGSNAPTKTKIPSGYRRLTRNGKELFCRSVVTLGSRFAEQMCFTREQLDDIANRTEATMDNIERSKAVCTGGTQCAGT